MERDTTRFYPLLTDGISDEKSEKCNITRTE